MRHPSGEGDFPRLTPGAQQNEFESEGPAPRLGEGEGATRPAQKSVVAPKGRVDAVGEKPVWERGEAVAAARAGLVYFAGVFCVGFVLGVPRTVLLEPAIGRLPSVALELPVILLFSWWIVGACLARRRRGWSRRGRALVGGVAFVCLLAAEALLAAVAMQGGAAAWMANFKTPAGWLGLAGQVVFALFPLVHPRGRGLASTEEAKGVGDVKR